MKHLEQAMEDAFNQPIGSLVLEELAKSDYQRPTLQEVCDWLWKDKGVCVTMPILSDDRTCYECNIQYISVSGTDVLPIKGSGGTYADAINDALHIVLSCLNEPTDTERKPTLCERIARWLNLPPSPLKPDERNWRSCIIRLHAAAKLRNHINK